MPTGDLRNTWDKTEQKVPQERKAFVDTLAVKAEKHGRGRGSICLQGEEMDNGIFHFLFSLEA